MKKRTIALVASCAMIFGVATGGTLAWLTAKTSTVTNTFTVGDINLKIYEHERNENGGFTDTETSALSDYKIVPGAEESKDPTVEVLADSEDCYVFLQVQEVNNLTENAEGENVAEKYITYAIDPDVWSPLEGEDGEQVIDNGNPVFFATTNYTTQAIGKTYNVLTNKQVSYDEKLTKDDLYKLRGEDDELADDEKPQLIFKAFAVQKEAAETALSAWEEIEDSVKLGYVAPTP